VTAADAHRLAREKGVSRPLYAIVKAILFPFLRLYFRMHISGADRIPASGAAIVAPNHKSFFDSFFIALATRRHLRFMGKSELFEGPSARLLVRLGAFPVRRGESDLDALATARTILDQGGLLALFPEGTRVRDPETLGSPRRGAGRLAIEAGAPIIPAAITGTDHLWLGPIPTPKRVQVAFAEPIEVGALAATPEAAGELVEQTVWPEVKGEFGRLLARPGLIAAGLAALGVGGGLALRRRSRRSGPARLFLDRLGKQLRR
jgi:1-acyl-sn-glycerol-3-phosphate acyltransferase